MSSLRNPWDFSDLESCLSYHGNTTHPGYCPATWDGFLCWPLTVAGVIAKQPCPENVKGILRGQFAYRRCSDSGHWLNNLGTEDSDPNSGLGWTNFTTCFPEETLKVLERFYMNISETEMNFKSSVVYHSRIFEMIGYSVSFASILMSLCILTAFRSLRTKEKRIHRHLYMAMLIQVIIRLIVYTDQFVSRRGGVIGDNRGGDGYDPSFGSSNSSGSPDEDQIRGIDNTPYLCELFYVLLEYARTAMFHWFFIEGLHLHNVLTIGVFPTHSSHRWYYLIGWGIPVPMTAAWAVVTGIYHNTACWFGYNHTPYYWILEGPRLALICVNLLFLLNILRVLLTKLKDSNSSETVKVRKAVKAAIVLQPLLGITNSLQMVSNPYNPLNFAVWSFLTTFLVSFQGFFAALFYCFLNGEVRNVLSKYLETQQTQRDIDRRASMMVAADRRQSSTPSLLHSVRHNTRLQRSNSRESASMLRLLRKSSRQSLRNGTLEVRSSDTELRELANNNRNRHLSSPHQLAKSVTFNPDVERQPEAIETGNGATE